MKKILMIVLAVVFVAFSFAACSTPAAQETAATESAAAESAAAETSSAAGETAEATQAAASPLEGKTIGFINAGPDDYYAVYKNVMEKLLNDAGAKMTYVTSDYTESTELDNANNMIASGVDAICLLTVSSTTGGEVCKLANDAGIPIFPIVMEPDVKSAGADFAGYVCDDYYGCSYMVGTYAAKTYPEDEKYITVDGVLSQSAATDFRDGFMDAVEKAGKARPVSAGDGGWSKDGALKVMQDYIASGAEFDAVFAGNEEETAGVVQALQEAGITGKHVYSVNGKEAGIAMIKEGTMTATTPNPPSLTSDLSFQMITKYFAGESYEKVVKVLAPAVLDKSNCDTAIPWNLDNYFAGRAAGDFEYSLDYYTEQMAAK